MTNSEATSRETLIRLYELAQEHLQDYLDPDSMGVPEDSLGDALDPPILPEAFGGDPDLILEHLLVQRIAIGFWQQARGSGFDRLHVAIAAAGEAARLSQDEERVIEGESEVEEEAFLGHRAKTENHTRFDLASGPNLDRERLLDFVSGLLLRECGADHVVRSVGLYPPDSVVGQPGLVRHTVMLVVQKMEDGALSKGGDNEEQDRLAALVKREAPGSGLGVVDSRGITDLL